MIGTAVRGGGCPPLARTFGTELAGSDFAKLMMAGWVPAYAGVVRAARSAARDRLEESVRVLGADGVVVSAVTLRPRRLASVRSNR